MNNYSLAAQAIKDRLSMAEITEYYGLQIDRAGFSHCPFHAEKTASFRIYPASAYCFGCGWGGDGIAFVREYFDLDFPATLNKINDDFQLGYPLTRKPTLREQRDATARWRKIQRERERQEQIKQLYDTMYHQLWDEYVRLDLQRMECAPTDPDKEIDPRYADAVKRIDYIEYLIDELL